MRERVALEREIDDLGLRPRVGTPMPAPASEPEVALHDFGTPLLPPLLRELEGPRYMVADPRGQWNLAAAVESLLRALERQPAALGEQTFASQSGGTVTYSDLGMTPPAGRHADAAVRFRDLGTKSGDRGLTKCIERSLGLFALACNQLDVPIEFVKLGKGAEQRVYPVPRIAHPGGRPLNAYRFLYLWFSSVTHPKWKTEAVFPQRFRGGGAAGALRYAGLAGTEVRSTRDDLAAGRWPEGLRAGALLQIWRDEQTYEAVRDGREGFGHSCIFRAYGRTSEGGVDRTVIYVADQGGFRHRIVYDGPKWHVRYLIGANPGRVNVV